MVKSIVDLDGLLEYTLANDAEEITLTNRNRRHWTQQQQKKKSKEKKSNHQGLA